MGAHRAGTDVDGVVNILCDARVTEKMMEVPSAIPIRSWLAHSNHSKARMVWETKMKAEVAAEYAEETFAGGTATSEVRTDDGEASPPAIVVTGRPDEESDDGVESDDSEEFIAEKIVGHSQDNKRRMYTVQWEGCDANDTSEEPAKRFGTELPLELLEEYFTHYPEARSGHPRYKTAKQHCNEK